MTKEEILLRQALFSLAKNDTYCDPELAVGKVLLEFGLTYIGEYELELLSLDPNFTCIDSSGRVIDLRSVISDKQAWTYIDNQGRKDD